MSQSGQCRDCGPRTSCRLAQHQPGDAQQTQHHESEEHVASNAHPAVFTSLCAKHQKATGTVAQHQQADTGQLEHQPGREQPRGHEDQRARHNGQQGCRRSDANEDASRESLQAWLLVAGAAQCCRRDSTDDRRQVQKRTAPDHDGSDVQDLEPGHRSAQQSSRGRIGGALVSMYHHGGAHAISVADPKVMKQANRAMGGSFSRLLCSTKYASRRRAVQAEQGVVCGLKALPRPPRGRADARRAIR
jgi:hypothetical protein